MKLWRYLIAISALAPLVPIMVTADEPDKVEMIFWEHQTWKTGGGRQRLVLWADGRSEVILKAYGNVPSQMPGWEKTTDGKWTYFRRTNPYFQAEVKKKLEAVLAGGIRQLKTFPIEYDDGGGTLVGVQVNGKLKETTIPLFPEPGEKDGQISENHNRFLAIEKILGDYMKEAKQRVVRPSAATNRGPAP